MEKNLSITAILGLLAIILGAFGAHALEEKLSADALQTFETGVRYQMYHVLALLFINTYSGFNAKLKNITSWLFFLGIFCFSGSIYLITAGGVEAKYIWFVTPLGGLFFLAGWLVMLLNFIKK